MQGVIVGVPADRWRAEQGCYGSHLRVQLSLFKRCLYGCAAQVRIERRREIREAQIRVGDREVYINEQGEKMSKLKVG